MIAGDDDDDDEGNEQFFNRLNLYAYRQTNFLASTLHICERDLHGQALTKEPLNSL